jgi:hypothetical protein
MPAFHAEVEVHIDEIARQIVTGERREDVHKFIMEINEYVSDYDFTKNLISELQEFLDRDDEVYYIK